MEDSGNIWEDAACVAPDVNPNWFFEPQWETRAKKVCADCPLTKECLTVALNDKEVWGIWGGLNTAERMSLLKPKR